ncbi:MAG: carbon-nitrogen hydrolase family protein [Deltaproteobacteria bacterium]|jgi:nitrilase|nr:carbon-nitrogen hydrolase family protein [Deltaproteobacteria bacterium]MBW2531426.1 carbon-nitrogen hydrolase family protein [Deltaproteobacteria bacterium]
MSVAVAVVQKPPVLLDLPATLERSIAELEAAAGSGAELVVFPEAYLPGYPTWIWRLRPGGDMAVTAALHRQLRANAVDIDRGDLQPLCDAAAKAGVTVVCGLHEIDGRFSGTTLFNTVVVIGPDGRLLNRHRKLLPTNPERMVWGRGDARGLRVVDTPAGRIGCLICWENYMPLARFALYAQNLEILVAPTWDSGEGWLASMRHIAREGGCWVISTATALQASDVPSSFPHRAELFSDEQEWINDGDAVIVRPFGGPIAGPMTREKGVLRADIDVEAARDARRSLDVAGHYGRPDLFHLEVDRRPLDPVTFSDG